MDDLLDYAVTRNVGPTWVSNYGKHTARDATILSMAGFHILHKYFGQLNCYKGIVDEAYELLYSIQIAENQFFELKINPVIKPNLRATTVEQMCQMQRGLIGPGIVTAAVTAAMIFNGYGDPEFIDTAKEIGYETMMPVSIFDDYLDCFASTVVNGKASNDILMGKQTWMLIKALELGSAKQFQRLQEFYGRNDPDCAKEVLHVYKELNIDTITLEMGEAMAYRVEKKIDQLPEDIFPCFIWRYMMSHYHGMTSAKISRI